MNYKAFWQDVLSQDREHLPFWFQEGAVIRWHCSNEQFTVAEYVRVNCDYPNDWSGEIERVEEAGNTVVLAGRVYPLDRSMSFHVVSFLWLEDDKIAEMDEYWADDGEAPGWRIEMKIGRPLRNADPGGPET